MACSRLAEPGYSQRCGASLRRWWRGCQIADSGFRQDTADADQLRQTIHRWLAGQVRAVACKITPRVAVCARGCFVWAQRCGCDKILLDERGKRFYTAHAIRGVSGRMVRVDEHFSPSFLIRIAQSTFYVRSRQNGS